MLLWVYVVFVCVEEGTLAGSELSECSPRAACECLLRGVYLRCGCL